MTEYRKILTRNKFLYRQFSTGPVLIIELTNVCIPSCIQCVKSLQIWRFFSSVFSRIRPEYGEIRNIFPYSFGMRENTDQKKTPYMDTFHAVVAFSSLNSYRMNVRLYFDTFQNVVIAGLKCRSSPWRCSAKKGILKFFAKFTGKHLCYISIKKRL